MKAATLLVVPWVCVDSAFVRSGDCDLRALSKCALGTDGGETRTCCCPPSLGLHRYIHAGESGFDLQENGRSIESVGKYPRQRQLTSPLWQFVAAVIGVADLTFDESVPLNESLEECVRRSFEAAGEFNRSVNYLAMTLSTQIGQAAFTRKLPLALNLERLVLLLRRRLTGYAHKQSTLEKRCQIGICAGWHTRMVHSHMAYLHVTAFHLADYLDGVPAIVPRVKFHFDLGVARRDVQRSLLQIREGEIDKGTVLRMAEIGVDEGKGVINLLGNFQTMQYIGVDPYFECEPKTCHPTAEWRFAEALSRLMRFRRRAHLLRTTSVDAASFIQDKSIDLVFVDALHTYEAARADMRAWIPKLRRGGVISGHDYSGAYPGVLDAVHEVFKEFPPADGILRLSTDYTWFWRPQVTMEGST